MTFVPESFTQSPSPLVTATKLCAKPDLNPTQGGVSAFVTGSGANEQHIGLFLAGPVDNAATNDGTASCPQEFAAGLTSRALDGSTDTTLLRFMNEGPQEQSCILYLTGEVDGLNISRPRVIVANSIAFNSSSEN